MAHGAPNTDHAHQLVEQAAARAALRLDQYLSAREPSPALLVLARRDLDEAVEALERGAGRPRR